MNSLRVFLFSTTTNYTQTHTHKSILQIKQRMLCQSNEVDINEYKYRYKLNGNEMKRNNIITYYHQNVFQVCLYYNLQQEHEMMDVKGYFLCHSNQAASIHIQM